jgi:hypothetical protein
MTDATTEQRTLGWWTGRRAMLLGAVLLSVAVIVRPSSAQVGVAPRESPYRDIPRRSGPMLQAGYITGGEGVAGVGLTNVVTVGARFGWPLGDMFAVSLGAALGRGERLVVDPTEPVDTRTSGPIDDDAVMVDVEMQMSLTGRKTWRGFAPYLAVLAGLAYGADSREDPSDYRFGTKAYAAPGAGVRWYPARRLALMADFRVLLWRLRYPPQFYIQASPGAPPVLDSSVDQTEWVRHPTARFALAWTF